MTVNHHVLIVEDDPGTSHLLTQIVRRAGYEAVLARNGHEALAYLDGHPTHLLLLDLMMRGMDGWTLLTRIRADERLAHLPVVIVTAVHPREQPARLAEYKGMYEAYFVKPFEVDKLVETIERLLNSTRPDRDTRALGMDG
ncbi:MAG: response regulator [Anaerolineae bacterium]|nr:response regulator [Anaerolineae bacterium]